MSNWMSRGRWALESRRNWSKFLWYFYTSQHEKDSFLYRYLFGVKSFKKNASFIAFFQGNSRNGNWIIGRIPTSKKIYTWSIQRVPNGSWRASNHHPLGSSWHPLEGAGTWLFWNDFFFKVQSLCLPFSNHVECSCFLVENFDYPPWNQHFRTRKSALSKGK